MLETEGVTDPVEFLYQHPKSQQQLLNNHHHHHQSHSHNNNNRVGQEDNYFTKNCMTPLLNQNNMDHNLQGNNLDHHPDNSHNNNRYQHDLESMLGYNNGGNNNYNKEEALRRINFNDNVNINENDHRKGGPENAILVEDGPCADQRNHNNNMTLDYHMFQNKSNIDESAEHHQGEWSASFRQNQPDSIKQEDQSNPSSSHQVKQRSTKAVFVLDHGTNGGYSCKHCNTMPYCQRAPGSIWTSATGSPPPLNFVEQHLSVCRGTTPMTFNNIDSLPTFQNETAGKINVNVLPSSYGNNAVNSGSNLYQPQSYFYSKGMMPQQRSEALSQQTLVENDGENEFSILSSSKPSKTKSSDVQRAMFEEHALQQSRMRSLGYQVPGGSQYAHYGQQHPQYPHLSSSSYTNHHHLYYNSNYPAAPYLTAMPSNVPSNERHEMSTVLNHPAMAHSSQEEESNSNNQDNYTIQIRKGSLAGEEDRLLLTDYFFYLMQQLQVCHFSECDRKTRGGKRDNIANGYGGMQCAHCANRPNARKFFWSDVDRLANSFAEIPSHILRCKRAPPEVKSNLSFLKSKHPEQMARLPRGSQKVFFRRMWRRLHSKDVELVNQKSPNINSTPTWGPSSTDNPAEVSPDEFSASHNSQDQSHANGPFLQNELGILASNHSAQHVSHIKMQSIDTSRQDLSDNLSMQDKKSMTNPSDGRILLAISEDKDWLSDIDCFIRKQLEVFIATQKDIEHAQKRDKYPSLRSGTVGIRCIHCACACAKSPNVEFLSSAVCYPGSIGRLYEAVREFQKVHIKGCPHIPPEVTKQISTMKTSTSLTSVLRRYFILAAKALGMVESPYGILAAQDSGLMERHLQLQQMEKNDSIRMHSYKRKADEDNLSTDRDIVMRQRMFMSSAAERRQLDGSRSSHDARGDSRREFRTTTSNNINEFNSFPEQHPYGLN